MEQRQCHFCNDIIVGRADKRFCTDQCRSSYKNQNRTEAEKVILQVNKVLRKNRAILKAFNPAGFSIIRKEVIQQQGFTLNTLPVYIKPETETNIGFATTWVYVP